MTSPTLAQGVGDTAFEAVGDGLTTTIDEIFEMPDVNIDGQLLEMVSGDSSYQERPTIDDTVPNGSNALAKDGGVDAALIDLLPF